MGSWSCAACTFLNENDALATCQVCHAVRVVRCAKCRQEITVGSRLRVADKVFHPNCFVCTACAKPFPTPKFSIKDGDPYHSACLPKVPEVLCAQCFKTIGSGPRLTVSGQPYHPGCFVCTACRKPFPTHQFSIKDGEPYHSECLPQEPVVLCAQCLQAIGCGPRLTVSGQLYHPDCFVCKACRKPFPTHQFMIEDGDAYHASCLPSQLVTCANCRQSIGVGPRVTASGLTYHTGCFLCAGCHAPFGKARFQLQDGEPYHTECFKQLYNPRCEVCDDFIPYKPDGTTIAYREVPFWNMRFCPSHENRDRCCGCQRIEPLAPTKRFVVLSDGRKVCQDCDKIAVLDTLEANGAVADVWEFMASIGISLPKLPVYLVEAQILSQHCESLNRTIHDHSTNAPVRGHVTRGLCLSEVTQVRHMVRRGGTAVPEVVAVDKNRSVTGILILHGLPYDLTAQVIAHEATHAYIKLSDHFPDHLSMLVEEGMCQLLSYLFLKYKQVVEDDSSPTMRATFRARLRAVLVQQIETDQTPVYGDGFRAAYDAYTRVHSLQTMFDSLRRSGRFP